MSQPASMRAVVRHAQNVVHVHQAVVIASLNNLHGRDRVTPLNVVMAIIVAQFAVTLARFVQTRTQIIVERFDVTAVVAWMSQLGHVPGIVMHATNLYDSLLSPSTLTAGFLSTTLWNVGGARSVEIIS